MAEDYEEARRTADASELGHPSWPEGVRPISWNGLSLLGVEQKTKALYWDGKPIVTGHIVSLRWYELTLATVATAGALLAGVHPFGVTFGWW